ncbi:MAG: hypothetical protein HKN10_05150 [Myxococcales bacterium]|nr:hypothetical protein [Myxococcales bacterium]
MSWFAAFAALALLGVALLRWGMRWGSTPEERARAMPGDEYLRGGPRVRVAMTRAITIHAPPERVWPWIAQLGRGAGWCSVDRLDNGGKTSAWHLVSWVPEPSLGDATAVGYLRHIDAGRSLAWWLGGGRFVGSPARLVSSYLVSNDGQGARLVSRISADTGGPLAPIAMLVFACIDSIMACRQLVGLRDRVEYCERNPTTPRDPETGDRGQYQRYEICYASGESAGVQGDEEGARWRRAAIEDGILRPD